MEDAYVIGIRLALEDGVSAGIATIAGELSVLDAAIATASVNLERLQELARSFDMPRLAVPSISRPQQGSPPAASINDPILAPPTPPVGRPQTAPVTETGRERNPVPSFAASPATDGSSVPTVPVPVIRVLTQSTSPEFPQAIAPRPIYEPPERPPTPVAPPQPPTDAPVAPTADAWATGPAAGFATRDRQPAQTAAPVINVAIAAPIAPIAPGQAEPADGHSRTGTTKVSDPGVARGSVAPAVPQVSKGLIAQRAGAPPYPAASAAPPPRDRTNGPLQGDVYLDGTRLGRWIADRLASDSAGPQAGITGFDPRLGATWPGALQGF